MSTMPTWDQFMAPVLRVLTDGSTRRRRELYDLVATAVGLTDEQKAEVMTSGNVRYENRIGWATSYLNRIGALERPARGQYTITDAGRQLLAAHPDGILERDLRALAGDPNASHTWLALKEAEAEVDVTVDSAEVGNELDPVEQIILGIDRIHADVSAELLQRLHGNEPAFFEKAVLRLLIAMGYGGADAPATHTRLSRDGGIDGIIDQDALGLSRIYVQAKRYALDTAVGRPDVQAFVGALHGNNANQGVFLTTGRFSKEAREYAAHVSTRVILIDGIRLASLMIRYGVGVQVERTVTVVKVDDDFFDE